MLATMRFMTTAALLAVGTVYLPTSVGAASHCTFEDGDLRFVGSPVEQARCLLTPVRPFAHLGRKLDRVPEPLESLIGQPVLLELEAFGVYLEHISVDEADLGGDLDTALSRAHGGRPNAPVARYFVIHDTSAPNFKAKPFPADIDTATAINDLSRFKERAHVYVNRGGSSRTTHDFATPWRATKFEVDGVGKPAKGLFLHVELIQPRRSDPRGPKGNDALAPEPGFTDAQLDRLALLYITASLRRGEWLIPAYHAVLDQGFVNGHDDPQNFDLELWAAWIEAHLSDVRDLTEGR